MSNRTIVSATCPEVSIVVSDEVEEHLRRHFTDELPGSKFFCPNADELLQQILDQFPAEIAAAQADKEGVKVVSVQFPQEIGVCNVVAIEALTHEERATLHTVPRGETMARCATSQRQFPTAECQMILTSRNELLSLYPGELAPPLPPTPDIRDPYWDRHVFISPLTAEQLRLAGASEAGEEKKITLKPGQKEAFKKLKDFVASDEQRVFILRGYAGTGKTTLMKFLIRELEAQERPYRLLASTGRAAKILSNMTGTSSGSTIHSMIYSFNGLNQDLSNVDTTKVEVTGQLYLTFEPTNVNDQEDTGVVYIVDEASMIADRSSGEIYQASFGSGRLLKELLDYDKRPGSKFLFVGDPCQLPPVTEAFSPALYPEYFRQAFGIAVEMAELTEIVRQGEGNDIVSVSQYVRQRFDQVPPEKKYYCGMQYREYLPFGNCSNIRLYPTRNEMVENYVRNVQREGFNHSTLICRANKDCLQQSRLVRSLLGIGGDTIVKGDLLMVVQNNVCGLMNGDMVEVVEVRGNTFAHAGLHFRRVVVKELFSQRKQLLLLVEDTVNSPNVNLNQVQQKELFVDFIFRMKAQGITQSMQEAFQDAMRKDVYLNALRCNYGYVITCHKAQGGEWEEVFVDLPDYFMYQPTKGTYQWIYTAMTRARNTLHLVNGCNIQ